jgi:hypothetical protein
MCTSVLRGLGSVAVNAFGAVPSVGQTDKSGIECGDETSQWTSEWVYER